MIKHELNYENWEKINTPEIAYFLGYFWADGCLGERQFSLELIEKDFMSIWPILQKIGFKNHHRRKRNNSQSLQCSIGCGQRKFVDLLFSLDCHNKSINSPTKILNIMPNDLKYYFFRGYIDGDGSICLSGKIRKTCRISINSTIDYDWSFMENLAKELNITKFCTERKTRKNKTHKYSVITFGSKDSILKLGNYIYQNYDIDRIGLTRKYNKFLEIENHIKDRQEFHLRRHQNALNRKNNNKISSKFLIEVNDYKLVAQPEFASGI